MKLDLETIITYKELLEINKKETTVNKIIGSLYIGFCGEEIVKDTETDVFIFAWHKDDETEIPYFTTMLDLKEFNTTKAINEVIYKQLFNLL